MSSSQKRYCSVFGCPKNSLENPELSFFTIPTEKDRRQQWLQLIDREDLLNKSLGARVCEAHFNVNDVIVRSQRKTLKKNCLPCMHLPDVSGGVCSRPPAAASVVETRARQWDVHGSQRSGEEKQTQTDITTASTSCQTQKLLKSDNLTQTPKSFSEDTPLSRKLKLELLSCKKQLRLIEREQNNNKNAQQMFFKLCDRFLSKNLAEIVKAQIHLNSCNKGNRYTFAYKMFCLNLYYGSPQAYRLLQKTISLPCRTTLNKLHIPLYTQVNDDLMAALKINVNNMNEKDKQCTIVVGSMNLKTNLFYNIKNDKIIGFHEVDGVQSPLPATRALVVMVRGIFVKWSQVVGFALLSECKSDENVTKWIDKIILKLFEIGLNVRVFVSDPGFDLFNEAERRGITVDKTYFTIADRKIYYIFDVPALIKLIRNNMMIYNFHYNNGVAKFEHILQFYEYDQNKTFKQAYKLTNSHINPTNSEKSKVSYATQLLSRSVASGLSTYIDFNIIDVSARQTVIFIKMMNDLFDALNSSTAHHSYSHKNAFCGNQEQIDFYNDMFKLFQSLKLYNPKNGNEVTESVKFILGFKVTIQSVMNLFNDLKKEGYKYILTRRLNQDVIDNFFGKIRAKNRFEGKPTSRQFISAFRRLYFANMTHEPKESNCAEDLTNFLVRLKDFEETASVVHTDVNVTDNGNILHEIKCSDYAQLNLPEENVFFYVCGTLLKKCFDHHNDCKIFKFYLDTDQRDSKLSAESPFLMIPPDDFVAYIERMEQVLCKVFEQNYIHWKIGKSIYDQIKYIDFSAPCPCFPKIYLQKLYIRMRIFLAVTAFNQRKYCNFYKLEEGQK